MLKIERFDVTLTMLKSKGHILTLTMLKIKGIVFDDSYISHGGTNILREDIWEQK